MTRNKLVESWPTLFTHMVARGQGRSRKVIMEQSESSASTNMQHTVQSAWVYNVLIPEGIWREIDLA